LQNRPYQDAAQTAIRTEFQKGTHRQLLAMATGTGKCLAKGTAVLMFDGTTKPVEKVNVGDLLMGPDSSPRSVLSLGRGIGPLYDIIPNKGEAYRVNDAHILSLYLTRRGYRCISDGPRIVDICVTDYLSQTRTFKHRAKGYRVGVNFPVNSVPIDPYFLGLWLGDGTSQGTSVTSADKVIEAFLEMHTEYLGLVVRCKPQPENASSVYHTNTGRSWGRGIKANALLNDLRYLNVINNKHVPHKYKANSREVRINLLSGYLDADGYLDTNGGYEYISVIPTLAYDIAFIARSLGLACYVSQCQKADQHGSVGTYYRGYISGDVSILQCKLERKQQYSHRRQKKNPLVTGITVKAAGYGEYYGFQLDRDGRFLLGDFTVTHNTVVFSQLPERLKDILPGQSLVLAHREELIDQAVAKMRLINPTLRIDKEKAEHKADPSLADVIVASVATLGRKGTKRLDKYNWQNFDKFITDEAHHSIASSYTNIYEAAGILTTGDKRLLLGVTATPSRGDGKALAQLYQKIVYSYSMRQAIEDGWLVDVRGVRVTTNTSLDAVKTVGGDFAQDMLADAVNNPTRNQGIVKAWLDYGENRQTIVFTVDIQHAVDLAEMFKHHGVNAEAIWGNDPERARKLERHRNGDITVLLNCGVLTEGYDDWRIGCIILARPTKSSVLFTQMVGRGTRLQDGTGNLNELLKLNTNPVYAITLPQRFMMPADSTGNTINYTTAPIKRDCVVIDVVDASSRHSLVTLPTLMGMSAHMNLKGESVVKAIRRIEEAQKQHSNIDFTQLQDITQLKTYIEQVNLFDIKFPAEVEDNSQLSWHPAADGGFVLLLPDRQEIRVKENILSQWEISGIIKGQKYKGIRDTIDAAFKAADDLVYEKSPEALKLLRREEKWHSQPATVAQLNLLRKLFKGKPLPTDLDKGKASKMISSFLAGKA
jgi:superfamily II DNA or RNA helicase